jgi:hypothetical protein
VLFCRITIRIETELFCDGTAAPGMMLECEEHAASSDAATTAKIFFMCTIPYCGASVVVVMLTCTVTLWAL